MMRSLFNLVNTLEAQIGPIGLVSVIFGLAALLGIVFGASLMGIVGASRRRHALRESEEEQELLQNLLNDTRMQVSRVRSENSALKGNVQSATERDAEQEREIRHLSSELNSAQISLVTKEKELSEKNGLLRDRVRTAEGVEANRQALNLAAKDKTDYKPHEVSEAAASNNQVSASVAAAGFATAGGVSAVNVGRAIDSSELPTLKKRIRHDEESSLSSHEAGIIPDDQIIPTFPEAELTANVEAYDLSDLEDLVNENL